jgi:alkylation response protein AidB-like acyl-CoA dehydrogenase
VRDFVAKEVVPHYSDWEKAGRLPREVFAKLGALGVMGIAIPERFGGAGLNDFRYNVILQEESARSVVTLAPSGRSSMSSCRTSWPTVTKRSANGGSPGSRRASC